MEIDNTDVNTNVKKINEIMNKVTGADVKQLKLNVPASVIEHLGLTEGAEVLWTVFADHAEIRRFRIGEITT